LNDLTGLLYHMLNCSINQHHITLIMQPLVLLIGFVKYTVNDVTSDTLIKRHKLQLVVRR